jgi:predicted amidohydrolase YtcJ
MNPAEFILLNADIHTMDPLQPRAQALAVDGGRVLALGADDQIRPLAGRRTRIVDAGGRLVLPGFQDTHIHLQDAGTRFHSSVDLSEAQTVGDLQRLLRDFSARRPGEAWLRGMGLYSGIFGAHNLDRAVLDAAVADRPAFIYGSDGHNAAINSRACDLLGLGASTADPLNGQFVRDSSGNPTGLLYEEAVFWVIRRMPELGDAGYADGVRHGQALCNRHGITGVLDARVAERHMRVYRGLDEAGELSLRIRATAKVLPEEKPAAALERLETLRRGSTPMASLHSAKFFLDGVLENRTAVMLTDYSDGPGGNGDLMFGRDQLREHFIAFDAARFQLHVHVIGDGAARVALDCIEDARRANGPWPSLHQLAHLQMIDPADIPRFRSLGVVANIQPLWARHEPSVSDIALPMVGEARGRWMYPWRSVVASGAPYAVSSDWGVSTLNPFAIMEVAVTRRPVGAAPDYPVFLPEQRLEIADVVRGYTLNAAAAAWRAEETGSLTPGKFADLIVLDRDIFAIKPHEIGATEVLLTLLGGREVHRAKDFAG